jgi:hypothetical protein
MPYGIVRPSLATPVYWAKGLEGMSGHFGECDRPSGKPGRRHVDAFQGPVALPSPAGTPRDMARTMSINPTRLTICRKIVKRKPIDLRES